MNCSMSNDYIMKYFDKSINDIEIAQLKQHMKSCNKCSVEFVQLSEIFTSMETAAIVEPPEGFEAGIMKKVNSIELARKDKSSSWLVLLYNIATVISIVLLMVFVADIKNINIFDSLEEIIEYFSSFSDIASAMYGIIGDIYKLIAGTAGVLIKVGIAVFKTYYYVFAVLTIIMLTGQRIFSSNVQQRGRETK